MPVGKCLVPSNNWGHSPTPGAASSQGIALAPSDPVAITPAQKRAGGLVSNGGTIHHCEGV